MGVETTATLPLEIALPNLAGLAKLARIANPVGAFGAAFFYDGNDSAGPYEEAMVNEINWIRTNFKGSIPSHLTKLNKSKKPTAPKQSEKKVSNKPVKEPVKEADKKTAKEAGSVSDNGTTKSTGSGPEKDSIPDHLYYAFMAAAGSPMGQKVFKYSIETWEAILPGPQQPTIPGRLMGTYDSILSNLRPSIDENNPY